MLELAGQMEHLAYALHANNWTSTIIKYFKILFIYEDYSVIKKVGNFWFTFVKKDNFVGVREP